MTASFEVLAGYVEAGWRLLPFSVDERGRKKPLVAWKNGYGVDPVNGGCSDISIIAQWHRAFPRALWGVTVGDREFVVDVDKKYGGLDTLAEIEREAPELLPRTLHQRTPSGGYQFFYRQPRLASDREVREGWGALVVTTLGQGTLKGLPGIEIRGARRDGAAGAYVGVPCTLDGSDGREWLGDVRSVEDPSPLLLSVIKRGMREQKAVNRVRAEGRKLNLAAGVDAIRQRVEGASEVRDRQEEYLRDVVWDCRLAGFDADTVRQIALEVVRAFPVLDAKWPWSDRDAEEKVRYAFAKPVPVDELTDWQLKWANAAVEVKPSGADGGTPTPVTK